MAVEFWWIELVLLFCIKDMPYFIQKEDGQQWGCFMCPVLVLVRTLVLGEKRNYLCFSSS